MQVDEQSMDMKSDATSRNRSWRLARFLGGCLFLIFIFVFAAVGVFAQSGTGKSALEGRILDPAGKAVAGVNVTIVETQTARRRSAITDNDGEFRFGALDVGVYSLEATATGFANAHTNSIELPV